VEQPGPSYRIDGEGWGLCYDATRQVLWQSDGSPRLRALGLPDLTPQGEVEVTEDGVGVEDLNELECVEGMVWANVWRSDDILLLDPQDGRVRQRVSLGEVVRAEGATGPEDVLNGIARADQGGLWVTGKNWGHLYRLEPGDDSG
jgi:glutamine cyclotransferase